MRFLGFDFVIKDLNGLDDEGYPEVIDLASGDVKPNYQTEGGVPFPVTTVEPLADANGNMNLMIEASDRAGTSQQLFPVTILAPAQEQATSSKTEVPEEFTEQYKKGEADESEGQYPNDPGSAEDSSSVWQTTTKRPIGTTSTSTSPPWAGTTGQPPFFPPPAATTLSTRPPFFPPAATTLSTRPPYGQGPGAGANPPDLIDDDIVMYPREGDPDDSTTDSPVVILNRPQFITYPDDFNT